MGVVSTAASPSVGDVFRVGLNDSLVVFGQVAASYATSGGHFHLLVFRSAFSVSDQVDLETIATIASRC